MILRALFFQNNEELGEKGILGQPPSRICTNFRQEVTMNYTIKRCVLFLVIGMLMVLAGQASAHNMWFDKTENGYEFAYGHEGKTDLYDPARVTEISGYTKEAKKISLEIKRDIIKDGKGVARTVAGNDILLLTGNLDNKYWFHTESGWKNSDTPDGLKDIIEEGESFKLTKHIVKWADFMTSPIGQKAEIVPLQNPSALKEGQALIIQLYFDGKPMPHKEARVTMNSDAHIENNELVYLTSSDPLEVVIGPPGIQLINAKFKLPLEGKKVVWYAFTLTFNTTK